MKKIIFLLTIILVFLAVCSSAEAKVQKAQINKYDYINIPFWQKYNDEILINHLDNMFKNNFDFKIAAYNIEESKRIVKLALSDELPQIAFNGYVGRTLTSSDEKFGDITIPDYAQYRYLLPLTLSYEADIWGKNRLKTKSSKKQLEMQNEDERSLYIILTSDFTINYYNLIKTDKLIEIQDELIKTQEQVCSYMQKRFDNGLASQNEVLNEKKNLTFLLEEKNNLEEKRDVLLNQLNVFLGDRSFEEIERTDFDSINTSFYIPETIDFDIVEKRPDVIKSKLKLEKSGYDIRVAKREFLPGFIISGNLGYNAYQLSHLFGTHTGLANIGVIPYLDIFDGGRKVNIYKIMKSRYNKAFEEYNKNILISAQEINDALYSAKTAKKNYEISNRRYDIQKEDDRLISIKNEIGTANIIDRLIKQEELYLAEKQNVSNKINEIIASVNLYKASGGQDILTSDNIDL